MWKIKKQDCYVWTVFDSDGMRCLQSAPILELDAGDAIIPDETVDVSATAFTAAELDEYVKDVALVAQEPRVVVRGWIRG